MRAGVAVLAAGHGEDTSSPLVPRGAQLGPSRGHPVSASSELPRPRPEASFICGRDGFVSSFPTLVRFCLLVFLGELPIPQVDILISLLILM